MNTTEQIITIATACGWTHTKTIHNPDPTPYGKHPIHTADVTWDLPLPDYLNDLNAMHEAEKTLSSEYKVPYFNRLVSMNHETSPWPHLDSLCATAAQRAEAFLLTLNLWKND